MGALIQRFENTIQFENFPSPKNPMERGLIFCDNTDDKKLTALLRKKHVWNPVPSRSEWVWSGAYPTYRDLPLKYIIEDPNFKDSSFSYFVQAADLCAFLLFQHEKPNSYMKRNAGHNYFHKLEPILCTKASPRNEHGIVRL